MQNPFTTLIFIRLLSILKRCKQKQLRLFSYFSQKFLITRSSQLVTTRSSQLVTTGSNQLPTTRSSHLPGAHNSQLPGAPSSPLRGAPTSPELTTPRSLKFLKCSRELLTSQELSLLNFRSSWESGVDCSWELPGVEELLGAFFGHVDRPLWKCLA